jgi:hypothetical protein
MPLIRALRAWFGRRLEVNEPYQPTPPGMGQQLAPIVWLVVIAFALPLILLLILVGFAYELVVRIDPAGRLGTPLHWASSAAFGIVLAVGVTALILERLR